MLAALAAQKSAQQAQQEQQARRQAVAAARAAPQRPLKPPRPWEALLDAHAPGYWPASTGETTAVREQRHQQDAHEAHQHAQAARQHLQQGAAEARRRMRAAAAAAALLGQVGTEVTRTLLQQASDQRQMQADRRNRLLQTVRHSASDARKRARGSLASFTQYVGAFQKQVSRKG